VAEPGEIAGTLRFDWLTIDTGTPVLVAVGDTQCAVYSVINDPHEAGVFIDIVWLGDFNRDKSPLRRSGWSDVIKM
jgi:hypothetical protein